jgi:hypothetical protein
MSAGSTGAVLAPQKSTTTNKPHFKWLSLEELATKRANGECYHCPEKYSIDHKCTTKGVFLIQLDDDMDEEDVAEDLGISLHALTGIDIDDTMKMHVAINGSMLVALVDSGSTHTFIREAMASQISLQVAPRPSLSVKVTNGFRAMSKGVFPKQRVSIDDEEFDINCYILPLTGFGVILGGPVAPLLRAHPMELQCFVHGILATWPHYTLDWGGCANPPPPSVQPYLSHENYYQPSSNTTPTSSRNRTVFPHLVTMITAYGCCQEHHRWQFDHIATRSC